MQIKGARKARAQTYFGITTAELVQPAIKAFEAKYEIRVTDPNLATMMGHGQGHLRDYFYFLAVAG